MITRDWSLDLQVLMVFNSAIAINSAISIAVAVAINSAIAIGMAHNIILSPDSKLGEGGVVGGGSIPVTNAVAIVVVVVGHHRVSETEHGRPDTKRG